MPHALLASVATVPVLHHVDRALLQLPAALADRVLVACVDEHLAQVQESLAGLELVLANEPPETAPDADSDLYAVARSLSIVLEKAPLEAESAYPTIVVLVVSGATRADVRARLEQAKLSVGDIVDLLPVVRETEEQAIAVALAPFEEHMPEVKEAMEAYLRGNGPAPVDAIRAAPADWYSHPSDIVSDALSGAPECWNEDITDRLWAVWAQLFDAKHSLMFSMTNDDVPAELGRDRAQIVYDAALRQGIAPVHAAAVAVRTHSASNWFLAPRLLAQSDFFTEAAQIDLPAARELLARAVPKMWLEGSPTVLKTLGALLEQRPAVFGAEALLEVLGALPDAVREEHIPVDDDIYKTARLAATLNKRFPGTLARISARWMQAATPLAFITAAANLLERDVEHIDKAAVWDRLLSCIEASPADPFEGDSFSGQIAVEALGKPDATVKQRIADVLQLHSAELPLFYRKRFEKLVAAKKK